MRVLFINSVCGVRSTGKICASQAEEYMAEGHECRIAYGRLDDVPTKYRSIAVRIGNPLDTKFHGLYTRLFDKHGLASWNATRRFIKWAESFDPDILWLHNLHGYYINYELLFRWIKSRQNMEVKWTLHDCWTFTGHCTHFLLSKCNKWRCGCENCPAIKSYPSSMAIDNSANNYKRKKKAFTGVKRMTIYTPSEWLASVVRESFLGEYSVCVQNNKIDTHVFRRVKSNILERYALSNKRIVLGVASVWSKRKGINDFLSLAMELDDRYRVVLIGVAPDQLPLLPANCLGIARTNNQFELAQWYSAADIFFNPTYEDTYPSVNLEASACGLYVVTYDTGGCRETLAENRGLLIPTGAWKQLATNIDTVYDISRKYTFE